MKVFGGIHSTLHESVAPSDKALGSINVSVERGVLEARGGAAELWKRGSFNSSDIIYGAGFGRWEGHDEWIAIIKKNGDTTCTVYIVDENGSTIRNFASAAWTGRTASSWRFQQFGGYILAVNEDDGIWRWKIGGTTDEEWEPVSAVLQSVIEPTGDFTVANPPYPTRSWNSATETGVAPTSPTTFQVSASPTVVDGNLVLTQASNLGTTAYFYNWFTVDFATPLDLIDNRYLYLVCYVSCDWDDARPHEEPFFDFARQTFVYITDSTDAPGSESAAWSANWKQARAYVSLLEPSPAYTGRWATVGISLDLESTHDSSTATILDTINRLSIGIPMGAGNDYSVTLGPLFLGGTWMSKPYYEDQMTADPLQEPPKNANLPISDLSYVVTNYDTGTSSESSGTYTAIGRTYTFGQPYVLGNIPIGTAIDITLPAPSVGYDRTRLYRKRLSSAGGEWVLLTETAVATSFTDSYVDSATDPNAWPTTLVRESNYDFGGVLGDLAPTAITAWKGHVVLGVGTEVYLSYQGDPTRYVLPTRRSVSGAVVTDDPTVGRTLYMSNTISDTVLDLHGLDNLYAIGSEGVYVMIGDEAYSATPFRRLPGSFGAMNSGASCPHNGGVLAATTHGLYFYDMARSFIGESAERVVEVTETVRKTYEHLLAKGAPNDVKVASHDGEIWIVRGRFFLKRNRLGEWEYGEYSASMVLTGSGSSGTYGVAGSYLDTPTKDEVVTYGTARSLFGNLTYTTPTPGTTPLDGIEWLVPDPQWGMVAFSRSGIQFRLGKDLAKVPYNTDSGYSIPYSYTFMPDMNGRRARLKALTLHAHNKDTSTPAAQGSIRVIVEEFDGEGRTHAYAYDRAGDATFYSHDRLMGIGGVQTTITVCAMTSAQYVTRFNAVYDGAGGVNNT